MDSSASTLWTGPFLIDGVSFLLLPCFVDIRVFNADSVYPDQMPLSAMSDLGLHTIPISLLWDAEHTWVNITFVLVNLSDFMNEGVGVDVIQQSACLAVNPITVDLFNCTPVSRGSDSMMTSIKSYSLDGLGWNFLCLILGSPGFNWWFSFAPVFHWWVLFDNPGISMCLSSLVLLSPHLSFIIGFICDLYVASMIQGRARWLPHGPNKYVFTTMEAGGEAFDPVKLD